MLKAGDGAHVKTPPPTVLYCLIRMAVRAPRQEGYPLDHQAVGLKVKGVIQLMQKLSAAGFDELSH